MRQPKIRHPEERGPPLHFAGRADEINRFKQFMANGDPAVGIRLVTGIPGIGKTQLLERFDEEARQAGMRTLKLHCSSLSVTDTALFMQIAVAMGATAAGEEIAHKNALTTGRRVSFSGEVMGAKVGGTVGVSTEHARQEPGLDAMLTALSKRFSKRRPNKLAFWRHSLGLMVTIDELQNIDDQGGKRLRVLHEGRHGCPILIVGAGLQLTTKKLVDCGISRTAPPINLERLSEREAYEAVCVGYSKATGTELDDEVATKITAASMQFPQHIVGYLGGAIKTFEKHGDVCMDRINEVVKHGEHAKKEYYESRLNAVDGISNVLELVEIFNENKPLNIRVVRDELERKGVDPETKLDEAIKHGMLTQDRDDQLSIEIPSFHSYLKGKARTFRENTRRDRRGGLGRD